VAVRFNALPSHKGEFEFTLATGNELTTMVMLEVCVHPLIEAFPMYVVVIVGVAITVEPIVVFNDGSAFQM
jgi:hypothetical protein